MNNNIPTIPIEEFEFDDSTIILDVRTPAEFKTKHIKGAFNVPIDELQEHTKQISKIKEKVVIICQSGNRASKACSLLQKTNLDHAVVLEGGILAWEKANKPLIHGTKKWSLERQVRFVAGTLVLFGIILSLTINQLWSYLSLAVGFGLAFSSLTNTCAMGNLLMKLPYNKVKGHSSKENVEKMTKNV